MMSKQKWQSLLAQLEIIESINAGIWSEERLQAFETETGIILPEAYKEFCQIFGSGMLGYYMRISYPNLQESNLKVASIKEYIDSVAHSLSKATIAEDIDFLTRNNLSNVPAIKKTLDPAFFFADNSYAQAAFWDLRTYSESDKSYDIYITSLDCFEGQTYQIGRDFFEFVRDFCLGMKSYEVLPESMRPKPQELTPTFLSSSRSQLAQLEEETRQRLIWQNNIASGAVFKMAISKEKRGQLTEALLLHIQHFFKVGASGEEVTRLFGAIARLQDALPEQQFRAICRATNFPAEQLLPMMTLINPRSSESCDVENLPEPDAEFQLLWEEFLNSWSDRYSTILADSPKDVNAESKEIMREAQQMQLNLIEATLNSPTSNLQQAWSTMERSLQQLQQKYTPTKPPKQLDENFQHLHLPAESSYLPPERPSGQYDLETEQMERAIREKNPYAFKRYLRTLRGHSRAVYSVEFVKSDRPIIASASADTTIKLWDAIAYREIRTLTGHTDAVISLATSPDGEILASGSADTTIKLWDLGTGAELRALVGHSHAVLSVAITPDGKTLASASADNTIKLWDLTTGEEIRTLVGHLASVTCLSIAANGKILASGSADATIKLWDLQSGEEIRTLNADSGIVFSVSFHSTTELLASSHGGEKTINLWNANTGEIERTVVRTEQVASVAIAPDGKTLSFAGGYTYGQKIGLLNLDGGEMLASFEGGSDSCYHKSLVYAIAFSPDSQMLVSGSKDATIKLWGIPAPIDYNNYI